MSNFMVSQLGSETIVTHILPNILKNKVNQTMKFGQSIQYNLRNIFLETSYGECGGKTGPKLFSEKLRLSIYLDQWSKVLYSLYLFYAKLRAIEIY